jgi:hypothetical protein
VAKSYVKVTIIVRYSAPVQYPLVDPTELATLCNRFSYVFSEGLTSQRLGRKAGTPTESTRCPVVSNWCQIASA